jgi:hypothetical protein
MDIEEVLKNLRKDSKKFLQKYDDMPENLIVDKVSTDQMLQLGVDVASGFEVMDQWFRKEGFLPQSWRGKNK